MLSVAVLRGCFEPLPLRGLMKTFEAGQGVNRNVVLEIVYVSVAALGGAAKYLHGYLNGKQFEFWKLLASVVVSVFTGVTAAHVSEMVRPGWEKIVCAVFAFLGGEGMNFLFTLGATKMGVEIKRRRDSKDPVLLEKKD